jgi:hypothetical protein
MHGAECPDDWLAEWDACLPQAETLRTAGVSALRSCCLQFQGRIDDGSLRRSVLGEGDGSFPTSAHELTECLLRHNYSAARAKRLLAASYREAIFVVQSDRIPEGYLESESDSSEGLSFAWKPNAGSRVVVSYHCDGKVEVRSFKRLEASVACLRAIIACERFRRKHGTYPDALGALVPEFLKQVPCDPYAGTPLHYSREREIVWAAGENLKDDGGSIKRCSGKDGFYRAERTKYALDMVYPVSPSAFTNATENQRKRIEEMGR